MAVPASTRVSGSAVADGNLRTEIIQNAFESKLLAELKLVPYCNRRFEEQMRTANAVRYYEDRTAIAVVDAALPSSANTAVTQWSTTRNTFSTDAKILVWGRDMQINIDIPIQDIAELSIPMLVSAVDDVAERRAAVLDAYVATQWNATSQNAVKQGINPQTGTEATLDQVALLGATNANYINIDGAKTGTAISLLGSLKTLKLKLKQASKAGDVARTPEQLWGVFMAPHLYHALETELAALTNTTGVFQTEQVGGTERKRLYDIFQIIETTTVPMVEGTGTAREGITLANGKDYQPLYVVTPRATTYGERLNVSQDLTPADNQDGPYYKHDEYFQYYCQVQDPRFLYKYYVRSEA